jgi:molecular chaperone DnaK (HSP70)
MENIKEDVRELQKKLEHQRGFFEGQLTTTNNSIQDLGNKLRSEMKEAIKEIKDLIEKKEGKSDNKKWLLFTSIGSPILVAVTMLVIQHFMK